MTFRFDFYGALRARAADLPDEAQRIRARVGIPDEWLGRVGVSGSNSSAPGTLRKPVADAMVAASAEYLPLTQIGDDIRRLVKSVYGDRYDAVTVNSAEAGLALAYNVLLAPSAVGPGEPGRARVIVPYERHIEHHGSYGRPSHGRYKDVFADRGATAGEFGLLGRRVPNVDIDFVKLSGARYEVHGIKSYIAPLLLYVDARASAERLGHAAGRAPAELAGFVSLGYDTPGLGYGEKDERGVSLLHRRIGELAQSLDVPYIVDNAWGTPFLGTDIRQIGADLMLYSMDKVAGGPTSGLIIGREETLINIRRAMGTHSERFGTLSSHGKGSHIAFDPGKEALTGTLAALRLLRDTPDLILNAVDQIWDIVKEEFDTRAGRLKPGIVLNRSANAGGVEINYQNTWQDDDFGIPIFTHEDRIAHTNYINNLLALAGVVPNLSDDANILITPGAGTLNADGTLAKPRMRWVVQTVFEALEAIQNLADSP